MRQTTPTPVPNISAQQWKSLCAEFEKLHTIGFSVRYKLTTQEALFGFSPIWWNLFLEEIQELEWLEIDPVVKKHLGMRVKPQETDYTATIAAVLNQLTIPYVQDGPYLTICNLSKPQI
jgi:hypothetical protein